MMVEIGPVTMHLGDAREIIPSLGPVDAIITDPVWPNAPEGMFPVADPARLLSDTLASAEAKRVCVVMRCDSDPRFLASVPARWPFIRVQTLPYAAPGYLGRVLGGMEVAYGFGQPVPARPSRRVIPGVADVAQPNRQADKADHPCPRNLTHMRFLVRWWSDHGETVLDPFAGSGTTLAAAAAMGRKGIGIEIEPKFFDEACRRIERFSRQSEMFARAEE